MKYRDTQQPGGEAAVHVGSNLITIDHTPLKVAASRWIRPRSQDERSELRRQWSGGKDVVDSRRCHPAVTRRPNDGVRPQKCNSR